MQVRITSVNKVRNYISYAVALLEEKGHSSVILKAMGQAINKAVVVGEYFAHLVHLQQLWARSPAAGVAQHLVLSPAEF